MTADVFKIDFCAPLGNHLNTAFPFQTTQTTYSLCLLMTHYHCLKNTFCCHFPITCILRSSALWVKRDCFVYSHNKRRNSIVLVYSIFWTEGPSESALSLSQDPAAAITLTISVLSPASVFSAEVWPQKSPAKQICKFIFMSSTKHRLS